MLEDTNKISYQRMQNGWIKKSIYTSKLLQKHMKQSGKCPVLQVYMVVENVEKLDVGWCRCVCVCGVCVCGVCVWCVCVVCVCVHPVVVGF